MSTQIIGAQQLSRNGSQPKKKPFKEKFVQIYEAFFRGDDPSIGNMNFWDDLFLLKVNVEFIEEEFEKVSCEQLLSLKDNINMLFYKCVATLKEENHFRVLNAMQTISALVRGIFGKSHMSSFGFDGINILCGFEMAEIQMQALIESLNRFLLGDYPTALRSVALHLLLSIATATDNISQNTLLEYFMLNSVFDPIVQTLAIPSLRQKHGRDAVLLLTLLVSYRKYDSANPYIQSLSILDDELALSGYGLVVCDALTNTLSQLETEGLSSGEGQTAAAAHNQGLFSALTSMVGSMFVTDEGKTNSTASALAMRANTAMLMAMYEAVHLNRNFISTLTHCAPEPPPPVESSTRSVPRTPDSRLTSTSSGGSGGSGPPLGIPADPQMGHPTNLLVTFLEYTSIILKDARAGSEQAATRSPPSPRRDPGPPADSGTQGTHPPDPAKLCLVILQCISEDQYANGLMHDVNMNFKVQLHRVQMRHRKVPVEKNPPSRPLACAVLDLMVEFILSHLKKAFPLNLYNGCLTVIHRILCYEKKYRVRLAYDWKTLWSALINLLKFVLNNETHLVQSDLDIFALCSQVVNIFNVFITYGDTFLPSPAAYDELYYEMIRMAQVFGNVHSLALRYTSAALPSSGASTAAATTACSNPNRLRESATRLQSHLVNIRAIVNHFTPRIDQWSAENHTATLSEDQVLDVVRANYDTLTLKLQESLDQYERYTEKQREANYFANLLRFVVKVARNRQRRRHFSQHDLLQEFSSIV